MSVVVVVHCEFRAGEAVCLDGVGGAAQQCRQFSAFFRREFAEHIVDLASTRESVADSEAKPCVIGGAQLVGDVFQSVMARVRSTFAQPQVAERDGEVIDHDQ